MATRPDNAALAIGCYPVVNSTRRRLLIAMGAVSIGIPAGRAVAATRHSVTIDAFEFKPAELTVTKDDEIEWRNTDPVPHTVTARGTFDSGAIAAGKTWKLSATTRGRFEYVCSFHPTMKGMLIVT